jgi:hypothetical protein
MKKLAGLVLIVLACSVGLLAWGDDVVTFSAKLRGLNEVPPVNTAATGSFTATIQGNGSITFTESYKNLSANPTFSHIHFGPSKVAGGVMIFLCGGGGQPACPAATSATYTGSIVPANVTGPTAQGVTVGDLVSALRLVRQGSGYVNIHSSNFPSGEIRGQVSVHHGDDDRDDRDDHDRDRDDKD